MPKTEHQEMEVERDNTILKNPSSFINDLIQKKNMFPPDVIKRISRDGGDNSMKLIISTLDKCKTLRSFPTREKKGSLCFRVNMAIIMIYCKDLEENYNNIRMIMKFLHVLSSFLV